MNGESSSRSNSAPDVTHPYLDRLLGEKNRVLGMLDRDAYSPTFGCLDRTYWAWKFTDFPGARFQEGLCYLAYLYGTELDGNSLHANEPLRGWLQGGFRYWASIQNRAGDFDEAYPGERSLAATAFTTFYLAEAYLLLDGHLDEKISLLFRQSLARAAGWLCHNDEHHGFLSNHLAAAAAALLHAHRILGDDRFYRRYEYFLQRILGHQSEEGWYEEYGGADPGYQTHGTFYLARCYELDEDPELLHSLERSCDFLKHFIHPDHSLGGEYASRNTQTYYPAGFEMLASRIGAARWIASEMQPAILDGNAAGLISVDAYNYFPLLNNYVFALRAKMRAADSPIRSDPPSSQPYEIHYPKAGLIKVRKERFDLLLGYSKGGVIKVFDRSTSKLVFSSCGYIGKLAGGQLFSSQTFATDRVPKISPNEMEITADFFVFSRPVMTPIKFLLFRVFSLSTGQIGAVATWLKRLLVKVLIYRKKELNLVLRRKVLIDEEGINLVDQISGSDLARIDSLQHRSIFTTIHMGSSRYSISNEIDVPDVIDNIRLDSDTTSGAIEARLRVDLPGKMD